MQAPHRNQIALIMPSSAFVMRWRQPKLATSASLAARVPTRDRNCLNAGQLIAQTSKMLQKQAAKCVNGKISIASRIVAVLQKIGEASRQAYIWPIELRQP